MHIIYIIFTSTGVLLMGCDYPIQASEYVLMARKLRRF